MASKNLSSLKSLKEVLKKQLRKSKEIEDIIIFGSFVKDKFRPNDLDIALVMDKKDYSMINDIQKAIENKVDVPVHAIIILFKEFYTEPKLWKNLIADGFSIKKNKFLRDIINVESVEIISFKINKMTPTEKTQFNRGLNMVLKETKSFKTGAGTAVVPISGAGKVEDFFANWSKAKKKIFKAFLL